VLGEAVKLNRKGTVTVRFWVAVPPGPDAEMVYIVVEFTGTTEVPDVGREVVPSICGIAGVIVTAVALLVAQVIVVVCPAFTAAGVAVNCVICGGTGCTT
jgi:uncharacterized protein (DUF697 family)